MKILLIPHYSFLNGSRIYLIQLLEYYYSKGYHIHLVLKRKQLDTEMKQIFLSYNIKTYSIFDAKLLQTILGHKITLIFENIIRFLYIMIYSLRIRPDVVVYSQNVGDIYRDILQLCFLKKFIYITHNYPRSNLHPLYKYFLNRRLGKKRIILTVSRYAKNKIITFWTTANTKKYVYYIYNYTEPKRIGLMNRLDTKYVLTLASVVDYKNPFLWIRVAELAKNNNIVFVWAGDGSFLEECRRMTKNISNNIQFIGYKNNVEELYLKSIIYFQPSRIENHSMSVINAMSYGLPCIVSNVGGLTECVKDGVNGFVVELDDAQMMAEKIEMLINDRNLRIKMGEESKKIAMKKFAKAIWTRKNNYMYEYILCKKTFRKGHRQIKDKIKAGLRPE